MKFNVLLLITCLLHNAEPDWIFGWVDEAKSGNYRGYCSVMIYDPVSHWVLKVSVFP